MVHMQMDDDLYSFQAKIDWDQIFPDLEIHLDHDATGICVCEKMFWVET